MEHNNTAPAGIDLDSLTRYEPGRTTERMDMFPIPGGEYVRFADVESLVARRAAEVAPAASADLIEKLARVSRWIDKFPVPTDGASAMMRHLRDVSEALSTEAVAPSDATGKADAAIAGDEDAMQQIATIAFQRMNVLRENTDPALLKIREIAKAALASQSPATRTADAKDAKRYRFLRDEECNNAHLAPYIARDCKNSRFGAAWLHGDEADAAIDAAMAASRKDGAK